MGHAKQLFFRVAHATATWLPLTAMATATATPHPPTNGLQSQQLKQQQQQQQRVQHAGNVCALLLMQFEHFSHTFHFLS